MYYFTNLSFPLYDKIKHDDAAVMAVRDYTTALTGTIQDQVSFCIGISRQLKIRTRFVGRNDIDWITTIRRNMNYTLGEDEQEAFIASGTPIRLMSMKMEDGNGGWIALPISNPNRRA